MPDEREIERAAVARRWKPNRERLENDPHGKTLPAWARTLAIGTFLEQGWSAYRQPDGAMVATGSWGDELLLLADRTFACTEYPNGYPRAQSPSGDHLQ